MVQIEDVSNASEHLSSPAGIPSLPVIPAAVIEPDLKRPHSPTINTPIPAVTSSAPPPLKRSKSTAINSPPAGFDNVPKINTFGWEYKSELAFDDNYIDLAGLVARSSVSLKGHMGCVAVSPPESARSSRVSTPGSISVVIPGETIAIPPGIHPITSSVNLPISSDPGRILFLSTNVPFFPPPPGKSMKLASEIHAEARLVATAARSGISLMGAWVYITFPPCKDCFSLLLYAGVQRIIFRRRVSNDSMKTVAENWGVELVERFEKVQDDASVERCKAWVRAFGTTGALDCNASAGAIPAVTLNSPAQASNISGPEPDEPIPMST
ncbi:hypothetical protein DFS34DRAFT_171858 [Phlyctochytrium arcticum]|nr:hypothetical protein DFS34DRAFT_171858 [Phlyctochytrium arcticum]